jgi:hypothetical protein
MPSADRFQDSSVALHLPESTGEVCERAVADAAPGGRRFCTGIRTTVTAGAAILERRGVNRMAGRTCYHCKQWVEEGEQHDCWSTTEAALLRGLPEELLDAWERLRETAVSFGEQRVYASHKSIMFSRQSCYFFVRPKKSYLELCVFLGRKLETPQVRRVDAASKAKLAHFFAVRHRDEVEPPLTDWLREAYEWSELSNKSAARTKGRGRHGSA